jgi:hypothetical protein
LFNCPADKRPVKIAVTLCPRGAYCRALAEIEGPELYTGCIRGLCHHAAEGINFFNQMPFSNSTDGWITTHLPYGLDAVRDQQCTGATSRRGERGLGAGMAATDHDHIENIGILHQNRFPDLVNRVLY